MEIGRRCSLFIYLTFYDPIGHFKTDDCDLKLNATGITVFVYDAKKSKQDMILRQKGNVIMDVNGARIPESINEKGQAFFQNLHQGDQVKINIDFSEPYKSIYPDSIYSIDRNSPIYLPVTLQGIDKITGIVLYNDSPLKEVLVTMDFLKTFTDSNGRYLIHVPDSLQKQFYTVWFNKKGFKSTKKTSTPQTQELMEVLMEKK